MGTICKPAYANIFMDHFEKKYIYPFLEGLSLSYVRFIDDIFFIRTGSKDELITISTIPSNWIKDITIKYPFSWHGSLHQKQQTIHNDL